MSLKNFPTGYRVIFFILLSSLLLTAGVLELTRRQDEKARADNLAVLSLVSKKYSLENPDISMNAKGDVILVWQEKRGKNYDIYGLKTHAEQAVLAQPVKINTYTAGDQKSPAVAIDGTGHFVVIWESIGQDGDGGGIYGQRFNSLLEAQGLEFRVHTTRKYNQMNPDLALNDQGDFIVVWENEIKPGGEKNIAFQRLSKKTKKIGEETVIPVFQDSSFANPAAVFNKEGKFMVGWQSLKKNQWDVFGQVFDAEGKPVNNEAMQLSNKTEGNQKNPTVGRLNDNQFLAAWEKNLKWEKYEKLDLELENIKAVIVDANGAKTGGELDINKADVETHDQPQIVPLGTGVAVIWNQKKVFTEKTSKGVKEQNRWSLMSQVLDVNALPVSAEPLELVSNTAGAYFEITMSSDGQRILGGAWQSRHAQKKRGVINFQPFVVETGKPTSATTNDEPEGVN